LTEYGRAWNKLVEKLKIETCTIVHRWDRARNTIEDFRADKIEELKGAEKSRIES
jgi:hypothetical protein